MAKEPEGTSAEEIKMPGFMDPIMWSVIGVMGFSLLVGTGLHALGVGGESFQKWSDQILGVAFLLTLGFIGGAFKGFFGAVGYYKESQ